MRINEKMKIRDVAGEHIVITQANGTSDMTKVMALNESGLLLYERMQGRDFELDDIVQVLTDEYEVGEAEARKDAEAWLAEMKKHGLVL